MWLCRLMLAICVTALVAANARGAERPIEYRLTFPEPQHRWMQVEVEFADLSAAPLELRMSQSSPGRYALHDFAKNVYDVHALDPDGHELATTRSDPHGWTVPAHESRLIVRYKVYGDRIDGTYLAVDETHAHVNMPAAILWARGLDLRPVIVTFEPPTGTHWQVATQLHSGRTPYEFSAPNLQYLMDSPVEFGPIVMREFSAGAARFRFALHHRGANRDVDGFVKDVERIVRQEGAIYGEFPNYEPGTYTFLADYLPYAHGDGMEHRNSTVMTSAASIANDRQGVLETVAHEFFHGWNVERIRPRSLEPFDLERVNPSRELWLAEGFTQYYSPVVLRRAGLADVAWTANAFTQLVDTVLAKPGRLARTAEEMSWMAAFTDGGHPIDRTNWSNSVISYYPFGGAIALALDLTLRERTDGRTSLDDFMRTMWRTYGKPGGALEGYVDRPYTMADAERVLAEVSGDGTFAREFFARYIQGHDVADYAHLLAQAGFVVQRHTGAAWLGDLGESGGLRLGSLMAPTWPLYSAGVDEDDLLQQVDGQKLQSIGDVAGILRRHKPGDRVDVMFVDRNGRPRTAQVTLAEDPHVDVVPVESTSRSAAGLTAAQKSFRDRWLGPQN